MRYNSMKRFCLVFLSIFFTACLYAQQAQTIDQPLESYAYEPIRTGDQHIRMGLQLDVPLFNLSLSKLFSQPNIYPGGSIFLGYTYHIAGKFALGGSLHFSFYPTLGSNLYFAIPIALTASYTFTASRMRFPISLDIGCSIQSYNETHYASPFVRPRAGVFYQYSPEWSFGGDASWNIVPQWYKNTAHNRIGNFLGIGFAARYHF